MKTPRRLAWLIVSLLAGLFAVTKGPELIEGLALMGRLRPVPLAIAIGFTALAVLNRGLIHRGAQRAVGLEAELRPMVRVSAAAYSLNKVVKTGGLGGVAMFVKHGTRRGQPASQISAGCLVAGVASHVGMVLLVTLTLGSMVVAGDLSNQSFGAATTFLVLAVVSLVLGFFVLGHRGAVHRLFSAAESIGGRLRSRLGRTSAPDAGLAPADTFFESMHGVRKDPNAAVLISAHALAAKLLGAGVLTASLAATGAHLSFAEGLMTYTLALIASSIAVLPGGLGAVEASMGALLARYGVDPPVAVASVVTFRTLDLWFPLLVGLVAGRSLTKQLARMPILVTNQQRSIEQPAFDAVSGRIDSRIDGRTVAHA